MISWIAIYKLRRVGLVNTLMCEKSRLKFESYIHDIHFFKIFQVHCLLKKVNYKGSRKQFCSIYSGYATFDKDAITLRETQLLELDR